MWWTHLAHTHHTGALCINSHAQTKTGLEEFYYFCFIRLSIASVPWHPSHKQQQFHCYNWRGERPPSPVNKEGNMPPWLVLKHCTVCVWCQSHEPIGDHSVTMARIYPAFLSPLVLSWWTCIESELSNTDIHLVLRRLKWQRLLSGIDWKV